MILGFSGKAFSGKDTCADYLIDKYNFVGKIGFSYNLKNACSEIFNLTKEQVYTQEGKTSLLNKKVVVNFDILSYIIKWMNKTHQVSIYSKEYKHLVGKTLLTSRDILQFVGTDIMRYYIPSYPADVTIMDIAQMSKKGSMAVVDLRFPNEVERVRSIGGNIVRVERPDELRALYGCLTNTQHASEVALDDMENWDYILNNNKNDLNDFYNKIDEMLDKLE